MQAAPILKRLAMEFRDNYDIIYVDKIFDAETLQKVCYMYTRLESCNLACLGNRVPLENERYRG